MKAHDAPLNPLLSMCVLLMDNQRVGCIPPTEKNSKLPPNTGNSPSVSCVEILKHIFNHTHTYTGEGIVQSWPVTPMGVVFP